MKNNEKTMDRRDFFVAQRITLPATLPVAGLTELTVGGGTVNSERPPRLPV